MHFERIRAEAIILGQSTQYPLSVLLKMMQPRLTATGIATQAEVDSLAEQLELESSDPTNVYIWSMSFCAWAYKP